MWINVQVFCFFASYLVAMGLELFRFLRRSRTSQLATQLFVFAGLVAQTLYLLNRAQETKLPPLLSSTHDWLLVLSWLAVISYLTLTLFDRDLAVGVFLLPIVLMCVVATYFVSQAPAAHLDALRGWKMLHASLLVLGMLGVIVGLVLSLMYLFQQRRLRRREVLVEGFGVPNLERLARLNRWAILIAVPMLTFGFATGVGLGFVGRTDQSGFSFTDPLVLVSGITWLGMVVLFTWLLTGRRPRGKQVALLTIWACGFLLVTVVGLQVFTGQFHGSTSHGSNSDGRASRISLAMLTGER